jgi:hypothetical protein
VDAAFPEACGLDSRFRGNDWGFVRDAISNDTTTRQAVLVSFCVPTPRLMRYDLGGRDGRSLRPRSELKKCEHERC